MTGLRAEVLAIGTELLLGQIVDTNSSWIGEQLALAGIDSHHQTKVGDNLDRIVEAIRLGLRRADAVICCGGLGPTQDDLTREALAIVMGEPLVEDEERAERIIEMFSSRGRRMPMNNLRQAARPPSARFIDQQPGTAPGLVCPVGDGVVYAVPGVPWEMQEMVLGTVIPDLRARSGDTSVIHSRVLRTWGESESGLAELLAHRLKALDGAGNPTIAFLASGIEGLKVRITAKAATPEEAEALVAAEEAELRLLLGPLVFGVDDQTMESSVLDLLAARGLTLGVAESLTGGLIAARLVDVPGASAVFRGGVVAYHPEVKFEVLGLAPGGVISEEAAGAMASGVRRVVGSDVGIGVTGVAGPETSEGHPPGTVCLGVDVAGKVHTAQVRLPGRRRQVREFSCISVLAMLRTALLAQDSV